MSSKIELLREITTVKSSKGLRRFLALGRGFFELESKGKGDLLTIVCLNACLSIVTVKIAFEYRLIPIS